MTTNAKAPRRLARRLFIFARHAESALNAAGLLSTDPSWPIGLTPHGTEQARRLGQQLANLDIDLAVATRFLRTQETVELALHGRDVPLRAARPSRPKGDAP